MPPPSVIVYDHFAVWGSYVAHALGVVAVCSISTLLPDAELLIEMGPLAGPKLMPNEINAAAVSLFLVPAHAHPLNVDFNRSSSRPLLVPAHAHPLNVDFSRSSSRPLLVPVSSACCGRVLICTCATYADLHALEENRQLSLPEIQKYCRN